MPLDLMGGKKMVILHNMVASCMGMVTVGVVLAQVEGDVYSDDDCSSRMLKQYVKL